LRLQNLQALRLVSWNEQLLDAVCLKETSCNANADIRAAIEAVLRKSEYFVLLAHPAAAQFAVRAARDRGVSLA
jgi:hypothetical protein